jgi:phospholipase C
MEDLKRRQFLKQTMGALGAVSAMAALPPAIRRALAVQPNVQTGSIQDIKHVVILMQENRSFDHYFGTLRGVRGFGDRFPIPLESGKPVWFQSDGAREIPPYHLDSQKTSALFVPDTPHSFADTQAAWKQGKFGEWPRFKTEFSMGHYQREDIPFQFALAEAFTICDAYHCSVTTGTDPNRIVFWSGSNFDPALGQSGINCTDADSEPNNHRGWITGIMPTPGYTYSGSGFKWPTLPDLLEQAGVSWRIYQDPNDNWTGAMHGGLAFETFRAATATSGSPLYAKGMSHWSLEDLRQHVIDGTLPAVSWILPSQQQSEHPGARSTPLHGGDFTAQVLDALTASSDSWSQTAFFVTFDENDGFFDHVPAPAVPSYNADGTLAGNSTVPLDGEYFSDPAGAYREPEDTISGSLRPWGLGARVPMYVISPWSRGGWVNSQVFDHTSMGMFLEKRFGIQVDSISPWHRAVSGDLTSAFDFTRANTAALPALPDMTGYAAIETLQLTLPPPQPPSVAQASLQEPGTRYSRALPYELHTSARVRADASLELIFSNSGGQGAVYHVYDQRHLDRIPRRYTVEAGHTLSGVWMPAAADAGAYDLWVYGTNGFVRTFRGNSVATSAALFKPEVQVCYEPAGGRIHLKIHNTGTAGGTVTVADNAYGIGGPWTVSVAANSTGSLSWAIGTSGQWYDFTVSGTAFERRFAGRMETGQDGISDPAMGLVTSG